MKQQLIENPILRDSNERLYYRYLIAIDYDTSKTVKEFLKDMEKREVKYLDSISRASRSIQEEFPYLRGKTWNKRKKKHLGNLMILVKKDYAKCYKKKIMAVILQVLG